MEDLKNPEQVSLENVKAINNLDTARMALRWALERINLLQNDKGELERRLAEEAKERRAASAKLEAISQRSVIREAEARQRERYYARIEEMIALWRSGKLDVASLVKQKLEASELKEALARKELQLQKDFEERVAELSGEIRRLKAEKENHERLAQDLQARFARAQTERQEELADLKSSRESFERERSVLLAELAQWRKDAQGHHARVLELEKSLALAEDETRGACERAAAEARMRERLESGEATLQDQHASLMTETMSKLEERQKELAALAGELEAQAGLLRARERETARRERELEARAPALAEQNHVALEDRERALARREAELAAQAAELSELAARMEADLS